MHPEPPFRDAADRKEASYLPDVAQEIDTLSGVLTEALAASLRAWPGDLPRSRAQFETMVLGILAAGLEDEDENGLGAVLSRVIKARIQQERAEAVLWVIALVLDSDNAQLTADCLAFGSGLHAIQGGVSEHDIAEKHGVSVGTVSWRANNYIKALDLPPSRGMKRAEARESYSERAHRVHGTTPNNDRDVTRRTRTVLGDILRIAQWSANRGDLSTLEPTAKETLKKAFAKLRPICDAVALL